MRRKVIELGLIGGTARAITKTHKLKRGKLRTLIERLERQAIKELQLVPDKTKETTNTACKIIDMWTSSAGWNNDKEHPATLINFCAGMIDKSYHKYSATIIGIMADILDYYARVGADVSLVYEEAEEAIEKWDSIMKQLCDSIKCPGEHKR